MVRRPSGSTFKRSDGRFMVIVGPTWDSRAKVQKLVSQTSGVRLSPDRPRRFASRELMERRQNGGSK